MPNTAPNKFTHSHVIIDDDAIAFKCDDDRDKFPWLTLHPANGIVVQTLNYYALVEASQALGRFEENKWTALTRQQWKYFGGSETPESENLGHATHGMMTPAGEPGSPDFRLTFFNAEGEALYSMTGTGIVFRNRDFKAWRSKGRDEIMALPEPSGFEYAQPKQLGVGAGKECFLSPLLHGDGPPAADALFTSENAFQPAHPYHDGSGDHVNACQQVDAAQQMAHLVMSPASGTLRFAAGEVSFKRYVELDRPFRIQLAEDQSTPPQLTFVIEQGGYPCSKITLTLIE